VIKITGHDRLSPLLAPTCEQLGAFKLGVREAAARIFGPDDGSGLDLADVKMHLSPFGVPVSGQSTYDIVIEVEVPWSNDMDISLRERSTRLRTAVRELAARLGYEQKVAVWGRIVRTEWITDDVPDFAPPGQEQIW
jgi:hypothetical protein